MTTNYKPRTGKGHFTGSYEFDFDPETKLATISCTGKNATNLRKIDAWSLAYVEYLVALEEKPKVAQVEIFISSARSKHEFESLRRRISYLSLVDNGLEFRLFYRKKQIALDDRQALFTSEIDAVRHEDVKSRKVGNDAGSRTEKDIQDFIARDESAKDNLRLAIFSYDFYRSKNRYGVLSEVPIGVFHGSISKKSRILPTYFIDFVSFTKRGNLAVIELKINDSKLEVISQILDYALYAARYKNQLCTLLEKQFESSPSLLPSNFRKKQIKAYVVNNNFHPRFDGVLKYYNPQSQKFPFSILKLALG